MARKGMEDAIKIIGLLNKKGYNCSLSIVVATHQKILKFLNLLNSMVI